MIIGRIMGKTTTTGFTFWVEQPIKKFDFIQVYHASYDQYVLCQINEIEKTTDGTSAHCSVIGYKDNNGYLKQIRVPFDVNAEVLLADEEFIKDTIKTEHDGAFIGKLEGKNINVYIDLNKMLSKHVAVLAMSGAGKSYSVGVLLEEILEKQIPLLIIDPHGEYSSLKTPSSTDKEKLALYGLKAKGFKSQIKEYGNIEFLEDGHPLRIRDTFSPMDIEHILPSKLSQAQMSLLFAVANQLQTITITDLIDQLQADENNMKWPIISALQYIKNLGYFASQATYNEMIAPGKASIINLRGISPDIQEIIIYKLLSDLFEERKKSNIPPFFTVVEEAHNFCPERSFGEKKSSKILRTIASEGRKFGMGLCVISQRPARLEKSVISQCSTQIILKMTNPNDLKAVLSSVEGITAESYDEIKNLPVGTALLSGVVGMPLVVNIRPRMTQHGGETVQLFTKSPVEKKTAKLLPLIIDEITRKEHEIMKGDKVKTVLHPIKKIKCQDNEGHFILLIDMVKGEIITDLAEWKTGTIPDFQRLSHEELEMLKEIYKTKREGFMVDDFEGNKELLQKLILKEFLQDHSNHITFNNKLIFSQLRRFQAGKTFQYIAQEYDEIKEANTIKTKTILGAIRSIHTIIDQEDGFYLTYK